ncbi:MAG: T9SS type A sorting domain-containing protein [Ignavibacteria bacterium]|nr:T9SS type A sorting domain-containing protein [Ignavibacteria bacterium]
MRPISRPSALSLLLLLVFAALPQSAIAQLTGTKTINPAGGGSNNYTTFSAAISALNGMGVGSGGVTFNVATGVVFQENLPALTASGTAGNPIVFQRSGSGANPIVMPATMGKRNGTQFGNGDAIIQITGGDHITFDGIDAVDDTLNFFYHGRYEYGYLLRKASSSDACKYVTIRNSSVILAKSNRYATGILVSNMLPTASATSSSDTSATGVTVTDESGRHEFVKIYGNTVTNALVGIGVRGYNHQSTYNFYDHFVEIGVDGANTVTGFGYGSTTAPYGIYAVYQDSMQVQNNVIEGGQGCTTNCYGIALLGSQSATAWIHFNDVTLTSSGSTSSVVAMSMNQGNTGSFVSVFGNNIHDCTYPTTGSGVFYGISNLGAPDYLAIDSNRVTGNTLDGTGAMYAIYGGGSSGVTTLVISRNTISGNVKTQSAGTLFCVYAGSEIVRVSRNVFSDNGHATGSGLVYGYYNVGGPSVEHVDSNRFLNLSGGPLYGIYSVTITRSIKIFRGDTMTGFSGGPIYGIHDANDSTCLVTQCMFSNFRAGQTITGVSISGGSSTVTQNTFSDFLADSSGAAITGLAVSSSNATTISNNMISDFRTPTATRLYSYNALTGIGVAGGGNASLSYNTVFLNTHSSSTTFFGSTGLMISTTPKTVLTNNIIVNLSDPGPTGGRTVAYIRSSSSLASYDSASNNNLFYAGSPASNRLIYHDGTSGDQTLASFIARVTPRDTASITELPPFVNVTSTPYNVHLQGNALTRCESGGKAVAGITTDYDGDLRYGASGYAGQGTAPDIGADEGDFTRSDVGPPDIVYSPLPPGPTASSRLFPNVVITDISGVNGASGTRPRVYYKKSVNVNGLGDNSSATEGWKWVEASGSSSPFSFTIDYAKLYGGSGVALGDVIQYFVVAQDSASTVHVGIQSGTFSNQPSSVALTSSAFPIGDTIRSYTISNSISGAVTVPGTYPSLTGAGGFFADVNAKTVTGNIVVSITDSLYEDGSNALNQFTEDPPNSRFTITLQPDGATERTVHGATTGDGLLRLYGADRVTFDGRHGGGGRYLRFVNAGSDAPVFAFLHDAKENTIRNCIIEGRNAADSSGLVFFADGYTAGNDSNTVSRNVIGRSRWGAGPAATLVCSKGGNPSATNSCNVITDNELVDFTAHGVLLASTGNGDAWNISGNHVYRTTSGPVSSAVTAIALLTGGNENIVHDNSIGGADSSRSGAAFASAATVTAIALSVGNTPASRATSVQNNRISNIRSQGSQTVSLLSILGGKVDVGTVAGNILGGGTGAFDTIRVSADLNAIAVSSGDTVRMEKNTVSHCASTQGSVRGIAVSSCAPGSRVARNRVFGLRSDDPGMGTNAPRIEGIRVLGGAARYANNQITIGDTLGSDAHLVGISDESSTANRFIYNSVVLQGVAAAAGSNDTYAFRRSAAGSPLLRNNALVNARANGGGTGAHFAIGTSVASGWVGDADPAVVTSNYNFVAARDSAAMGEWASTAQDFAAWKGNATNNDVFSHAAIVASASSVSRVLPTDLFPAMASGNLAVDSMNTACWFLNGKAIAGSESDTIGADMAGEARRSTIAGIASDIGSCEFSTTTLPTALLASGAPGASQTTSYWFAGRKLADIAWGSSGTVPDSITARYFPGVNPPSPLQGHYANGYWNITAFGGSGYTYDLTLLYTPAILGTIGTESDVRVAKRDGGVWTHYPGAVVSIATKTVSVSGLTSFSDFTLSDAVHPLPVQLVAFTAVKKGDAVELRWRTASELNSLRFGVERRAGTGDAWTEIGSVGSIGSVDHETSYQFTDAELPKADELYYRLRKIDRDGTYDFSNEVRVALATPTGFEVFASFPNPFVSSTAISFALPQEQFVTVRVYDASGRIVESLVEETLPAGTHTATFHAMDLPNGAYQYVITAGGETKAGTMILAR